MSLGDKLLTFIFRISEVFGLALEMADNEQVADKDVPDAADAHDNVNNMLRMKPLPEPIIVEPPTPPPTPLQSPASHARVEAIPPPAPPVPERKAKRVTLDLMDVGFQDQRIGTPVEKIARAPQAIPPLISGAGIAQRTLPQIEAESASKACACI